MPFDTAHIDHLDPFVKSKAGNIHVFVIIDAFTKFILIHAVKNTSTEPVIKCLNAITKVSGVPRRIISGRGRALINEKFRMFCFTIGTKHHLNAVVIPPSNGQVEGYNRTILNSTMGANTDDTR